MEDAKTALSISSHVTHGYVGNRATVFPLQYCGWNVDAINTTDFSNHPGYGKFQGTKNGHALIQKLFNGLKNLALTYDIILLGYCPSEEVISTAYEEILSMLNERHSYKPLFVVDPVLGDNGKLYVPSDIVDVHIQFLKKGYVDLITPNQFELELLTGVKINSWESVKTALLEFVQNFDVPNIVISSVVVDGAMFSVGFSAGAAGAEQQMFRIPIDEIECKFSGCGDVFTALMTLAFYDNKFVLNPTVLGEVLAKLRCLLIASFEIEKQKIGRPPTVVQDVQLIQSRHVLDMHFGALPEAEYF